MTIQPVFSVSKIIPFGVKVLIRKEFPARTINPTGPVMEDLTFKPYSDALRVLETASGRIKMLWNYAQLKSKTSVILKNNPSLLPTSKNKFNFPNINLQNLPKSNSPASQVSDSSSKEHNQIVDPSGPNTSSRGYAYVPYYETAPQDVSRRISTDNIIEGGQRKGSSPENLFLVDASTYKQAISDHIERQEWKIEMQHEFDSLTTHKTGELIPYPKDGAKVIWGMWQLTRKKMNLVKFIIIRLDGWYLGTIKSTCSITMIPGHWCEGTRPLRLCL
ncbi:hypothetical protein O181_066626 [Austropuccinia psidii MF-1]|uniref:Uncharacterized protein n=1 Tax=Austropuccinia psidii MF-1 TaxID=1389203 RepID=A0A9Q3EY15_9BASI|nr:hypothetical protein [Austropuccinia psidii MF-1]